MLEFLIPSFCLNCQRLGPALCNDCYHGLQFFTPPTDQEATIMARLTGPLAKLLKAYKYGDAKNLARFIAQLLYQHTTIDPSLDYLTFIPLHPRKLRQRGFNQCQEVAEELSQLAYIPLLDCLERTIYLSPQAQIKDQQQRQDRVQGIFKVKKVIQPALRGKRILLLDDVWTTGATWREAQSVLLAGGAASVKGLIIASKKDE